MRNILTRNNQAVKTPSGVLNFNNLQPEYIKAGVTIQGVTGTYAGVMLDTVLENNSWENIRDAIAFGSNPSVWLGQTKEIKTGTYAGYHLQLVDLTQNRYVRTELGGKSKGIFQFVEVLPTQYAMSDTTAYNWNATTMRTNTLPNILSNLPEDIQNVISEVRVTGFASASNVIIQESVDKLFLPCEYELFGVASNPSSAAESSPQWQYYAQHNTDEYRQKKILGGVDNRSYWLRTPETYGFYTVAVDGSEDNTSYNDLLYIAPCFAM